MRKWVAVVLLICLLLLGCGKNPEAGISREYDLDYGEIPDIDTLFQEFTEKMQEALPGWNWQGPQLTDCSHNHKKELISFYEKTREKLLGFDDAALTSEQRFNRDLLIEFLGAEIEGGKYLYHEYYVNPFNGVPFDLPHHLATTLEITCLEDAQNYVAKLRAIPGQLEQVRLGIEKQFALGIIPPHYILATYALVLNQFAHTAPRHNILYTSFETKVFSCEQITSYEKDSLKQTVLKIIEVEIYPAYLDLLELLRRHTWAEAEPAVTAGIWELPQGNEYYAHLVRKYTTTHLSPQEIHDIGLQEVERIHGEIRKKLAALGLAKQDPVAYLREIGKQDLLTNKKEILAEYDRIAERTRAILPKYFSNFPETPFEVQALPAYREVSYTNAYRGPHQGRPGVFFANLSLPLAKSDMEALAFHHGLPGRHLQAALQAEAELPEFRSLFRTMAYDEGWGLYVERLMYEEGCYSNPLSELGYLKSELLRAAQLVIDTGLHHYQWTWEDAEDYLWETVGLKRDYEIDRCIVRPGEALACKIGQLKILQLREMAREALGKQFDLREFHGVVLSTGSVPLDILEQEILKYIEAKKDNAG